MSVDYPFVKLRRHPNCLLLQVQLRGGPTRRQRRAFFSRMHAECRRLGLVMGQKLGVCVLFGAERICASAHRQQIVGWLIDQPETAEVDVGQLEHLGNVFLAADATARPSGAPDDIVWRAAAGMLAQWLHYLHGRLQ